MFVQSSLIRRHFEYLRSRGVAADDLYSVLDCYHTDLLDAERSFSLEDYAAVLNFALEKTGDVYYGLKMGQEPHIAGTVGMLCASCRNLREAFIQGCRYFSMQGNIADIEFITGGRNPAIRYSPASSLSLNHPEAARQDTDIMFSFLSTILRINSNDSLQPCEVRYQWEPPVESLYYKEVFGRAPVFGAGSNEMLFRESDLGIPMKAFNPETFELLKGHVEKQIRKMDRSLPASEKVRSILLSSRYYSFPDMETVATKMNVSARTLQRMLSNEKTNFKSLLQDIRQELATQLLRQEDLTVSEIAYTLGYSDVGNFSRSFKKAAGLSPQEFRLAQSRVEQSK